MKCNLSNPQVALTVLGATAGCELAKESDRPVALLSVVATLSGLEDTPNWDAEWAADPLRGARKILWECWSTLLNSQQRLYRELKLESIFFRNRCTYPGLQTLGLGTLHLHWQLWSRSKMSYVGEGAVVCPDPACGQKALYVRIRIGGTPATYGDAESEPQAAVCRLFSICPLYKDGGSEPLVVLNSKGHLEPRRLSFAAEPSGIGTKLDVERAGLGSTLRRCEQRLEKDNRKHPKHKVIMTTKGAHLFCMLTETEADIAPNTGLWEA